MQGTGLGLSAISSLESWALSSVVGCFSTRIHLGLGIVAAIINATIGALILLLIIRLVRGGGGGEGVGETLVSWSLGARTVWAPLGCSQSASAHPNSRCRCGVGIRHSSNRPDPCKRTASRDLDSIHMQYQVSSESYAGVNSVRVSCCGLCAGLQSSRSLDRPAPIALLEPAARILTDV